MRGLRFLISLREKRWWEFISHSGSQASNCILPHTADVNFNTIWIFWANISNLKGSRKIIEPTNTVFAGLEIHHNPTCTIHQTSNNVQVLCQHDLHRSRDAHSSNQWRMSGQKRVMQTQRHAHTKYLSSNFELNNSANGAVSVYRPDQGGITVQGLEHTCRPWRQHEVNGFYFWKCFLYTLSLFF